MKVQDLKVGDTVKGEVTSITDFGAFVKVGPVEGLLHNQEVSWDKNKTAKSEHNEETRSDVDGGICGALDPHRCAADKIVRDQRLLDIDGKTG